MRRFLVLLGLALAGIPLAAESDQAPVVMRLGYVSFDGETDHGSASGRIEWLERVIEETSRRTTLPPFDHPIEFSVHPGNHHQVYEWLRHDHVDAAIVGPFTRVLLGSDTYTLADAVHRPEHRGRHRVLVRTEPETANPIAALEETFAQVLECAASPTPRATDACTASGSSTPCETARKRRFHALSPLATASFLPVIAAAQEWIEHRAPDDDTRERFWTELVALFDFLYAKGTRRDTPAEGLAFKFSFDNGVDMGTFPVPDNALVVRRAWVEEFVGHGESGFGELSRAFVEAANFVDGPAGKRSSRFVGFVEPRTLGRELRKQIERLWNAPTIGGLFERWYAEGEYELSIDETIAILRQDQRNSREHEVALVLPGGGVKAAYQARLLDLLYATHVGNAPDPPEDPSEQRLRVQRVIGTSGGAITGIFAALRPWSPESDAKSESPAALSYSLQGQWKDVEATEIFSPRELLRWAGVVASFVIFAIVLSVGSRVFNAHPESNAAPEGRDSDWVLLVALPSLILVFPFIPKLLGPSGFGSSLWPDALLFAWLVTFSYGVVSIVRMAPVCSTGSVDSRLPAPLVRSAWLVTFGLALLLFFSEGRGLDRAFVLEVGVVAAAILIATARARLPDRWVHDWTRFRAAVVAIAFVVFATHLALGALYIVARFTLLEITLDYWIGILVFSLAASILCLLLSRREGSIFESALVFLCETQAHRLWQGRRVTMLAFLAVAGFAFWNFLLAPGLYPTDGPLLALERKLVDYGDHAGSIPDRFDLRADLILTAATLDRLDNGLEPGDVYFCIKGPSACRLPLASEHKARRWIVDDPESSPLMDLIVASGAAFPVFAPHLAEVEGSPHYLIDGGYGHNVPIEAAALSGARQVLIVHSSPRPDPPDLEVEPGQLPGLLVHYLSKVPGFLFDLSQQLDVKAQSGMVVASLAPSGPADGFPFLADFRPETIERILCHAESDISHRIGRIESWGLPGRPIHYVDAE